MRILERHLPAAALGIFLQALWFVPLAPKETMLLFLFVKEIIKCFSEFGNEGLYSRVRINNPILHRYTLRCVQMLFHRNITEFWANSFCLTLSPRSDSKINGNKSDLIPCLGFCLQPYLLSLLKSLFPD